MRRAHNIVFTMRFGDFEMQVVNEKVHQQGNEYVEVEIGAEYLVTV